jgi:hypothetical protein
LTFAKGARLVSAPEWLICQGKKQPSNPCSAACALADSMCRHRYSREDFTAAGSKGREEAAIHRSESQKTFPKYL